MTKIRRHQIRVRSFGWATQRIRHENDLQLLHTRNYPERVPPLRTTHLPTMQRLLRLTRKRTPTTQPQRPRLPQMPQIAQTITRTQNFRPPSHTQNTSTLNVSHLVQMHISSIIGRLRGFLPNSGFCPLKGRSWLVGARNVLYWKCPLNSWQRIPTTTVHPDPTTSGRGEQLNPTCLHHRACGVLSFAHI